MKSISIGVVLVAATLSLGAGRGDAPSRTYEVTFTNVTQGTVLTPPIFSLSYHQIDVFKVGEAASTGLEMLAEGGMTGGLKTELEAVGVQDVVQTETPVLPGESITVELEGDRFSRLNLASMLLPTNDGFVAMNGTRVWRRHGANRFYLKSYDAGTELNDELCASIPGPQCGGEGFVEGGGEGFVAPHPGIHGEADLSRMAYGWGEPVAKVTVRLVWD